MRHHGPAVEARHRRTKNPGGYNNVAHPEIGFPVQLFLGDIGIITKKTDLTHF